MFPNSSHFFYDSADRILFRVLVVKVHGQINKNTHPEVLLLEAGDPPVGCPDLVDKLEKRVQVVEAADALVQRRHHLVGVLRQLLGRGLLLLCFELFELGEHVQQVGVFLE